MRSRALSRRCIRFSEENARKSLRSGLMASTPGMEVIPSTLTADIALLLAKLSDAELAPLEAVAEDVGVDPAPYYTTRSLGEAFLAKCDFERLSRFGPLFEGEAGPAQAARAALLPNTFLQALVCRALTGRVPPEEMEI